MNMRRFLKYGDMDVMISNWMFTIIKVSYEDVTWARLGTWSISNDSLLLRNQKGYWYIFEPEHGIMRRIPYAKQVKFLEEYMYYMGLRARPKD